MLKKVRASQMSLIGSSGKCVPDGVKLTPSAFVYHPESLILEIKIIPGRRS